jgi:hypothetical protein
LSRRLLRAFRGILSTFTRPSDDETEKLTVGAIDVTSVTAHRDASAMRWMYIDKLRISPVRVYVTISASDDAHGLLSDLTVSKLPFFAFVEAAKAMITNIDRYMCDYKYR